MNTSVLARSAYAQVNAIAPSHRDTEYRAFATVTRDLAEHAAAGPETFPKLVEALDKNRRLWTIIAQDVAGEGNALPETLRAQLLYLAEFTLLHTPRILRKEASANVLVEINTAIMRGLRGTPVAGGGEGT